MDSWRHVWRNACAPLLSTASLEALRIALASDDPGLIQGANCVPSPVPEATDWPVEAGCLVAYAGWRGEGLSTVGEVEEFFARICFQIDQALDEPAGCRWLLNWFDETPRGEMRRELLAEVGRSLAERAAAPAIAS